MARNGIPSVLTWDGGLTRAFLELWVGLTSVTDVSMRVVARTEGLHSIEQS